MSFVKKAIEALTTKQAEAEYYLCEVCSEQTEAAIKAGSEKDAILFIRTVFEWDGDIVREVFQRVRIGNEKLSTVVKELKDKKRL